jgi:amylosucrase
MPWDVAARRHTPGTIEHRMWTSLRRAIDVRASLPAMHASIESRMLDPVNPAVVASIRAHPVQPVAAVYNVSDQEQSWPRWAVPLDGSLTDALTGRTVDGSADALVLRPYEALWLVP